MKKADMRQFRLALRILEREISLRLALEQSCCGVTLAQCYVLLELEMNSGLMLNDLAVRTGLDKSTLSRTVDSLVCDGFVARTVPDHNRRSVSLSLTEKGIAEADAVNEICDRYYRRILDAIEPDSRTSVIDSVLCAGRVFEKVRMGRQKCCGIVLTNKEK